MTEQKSQLVNRVGKEKQRSKAANDNEASPDPMRLGTADEASQRAALASDVTAGDQNGAAKAIRVPANDNDILVSDDLPRPLPIAVGEANVVRKLLGERFRQLLLTGEEPS